MLTILIKNGTIIDPGSKKEEKGDLLISRGRITAVGGDLTKEHADRVIDASGCYDMPGLIDMHVHLRDPGQEYKETIETGGRAAVRGGFSTIVAMPNTKPVADRPDIIKYVTNKAQTVTRVNVIQAGAITKGMQGEELADIEGVVKAGSLAISEDGKSVMNAGLYEEALRIAAGLHIPVLTHCEDISLVRGGVMNEGKRSKELGLPGISNAVENIILARDMLLARETGAHLHVCHCSTRESLLLVQLAKRMGISISAEVCPHHFVLCEDDIPGDDPNFKMNPPLRTKEDRAALIRGLKDGTFDVIATDHAPHARKEKTGSMVGAAFGIVGLETAAQLTYTHLVRPGILSIMDMAEKMSYHPAKILGIPKGELKEGMAADVLIFDPRTESVIDPSSFASKGKNTPFAGHHVCGSVRATIISGEVAFDACRHE